ncbi:MAG: molybdopterin-guanine dinucleotide biosynthesis protein MobB [Desulfovibrio sp.]|nr:MAG: molybdopterin-guanine dinucleotide biosynthesis protein MobB [Desulfovibrio sp.]
MQGIQIVGFKNSGKTTLAAELAEELGHMGRKPAFAKYSSHNLDKQDTDTERLLKVCSAVAGMGPDQAGLFWSEFKHLNTLIPLMDADLLIVEGGKQLGWMPRILVLREPSEVSELRPDLALATYGPVTTPDLPAVTSVPDLARLVLERGFLLPGLDCGACGLGDCAGLTQQILAGERTMEACKSMNPAMEITINGQPMALKPFVEYMIAGALRGMLKELKGWSPGPIDIHLEG